MPGPILALPMKLPSYLLLLLGLPACATGTAPFVPGEAPDAAITADPDGGVDPDVDAAPELDAAPPAPVVAPLLLTEVVLAPTEGEFIEVANPTDDVVALDHYYLSDAPSYFRVPANGQTLDTADFIARFPAGATLAPGAVATVALSATPTFTPTYALSAMTVVASSGTPTLTNGGELVALFYWDGTSDLVVDIDLLLAGAPTAANGLTMKTAVALDGPDAGDQTSAYKSEAGTLPAQASAPGSALSTKRILLEAGHEQQGGQGNGVGGDDETSEITTTTWDATFTAPTPGTTPLAL